MNSDVIENLFSSQRSRCHGANTNPNVISYATALNTVNMTVDIVKSSKRNAMTDSSVGGAYPYNVLASKTFREKGSTEKQ